MITRRRRSFVAALAILAVLALAGCAVVLGFEEHEPFPPGADGGPGAETAPPDTGSPADTGADGPAVDPPVTLATGQSAPLGIATDADNVYWVTELGNTLASTNKRTGGAPRLIAQNLHEPKYIGLDDTRIYIGQAGQCSGAGGVISVRKDGSSPLRANYNCSDLMTGLTVTPPSVYGIWRGQVVLAFPADLSDVVELSTGVAGVTGVVGRGADVYFTSATAGTLTRVTRPAPDAGTFASGQAGPQDLAVDATDVYWLNEGGTVMKLASATPRAAPTTLASDQPSPRKLALSENAVFFTCGDGSVRRVAKSGGPVTIVATAQEGATGITTDRDAVYWTTRIAGTVMRAAFR